MEKEKNNQLSLLEILKDGSPNKLITNMYRKPTYTGSLRYYNSFTSPYYKKGLRPDQLNFSFCGRNMEDGRNKNKNVVNFCNL